MGARSPMFDLCPVAYMWTPEVSVHRDYEERGGFSGAKYTTFARIEATQSAYGANPRRARAGWKTASISVTH